MGLTNYEWFLKSNLDKFAGRWVAIDQEQVLDSDNNLKRLREKVKAEYPRSRPLFTKVRNTLLRLHS